MATKHFKVTGISTQSAHHSGIPVKYRGTTNTEQKDELKSIPLTKTDYKRRKNNNTDDNNYDIIICGAGTAGSLLTYRLAKKYPNAKILVLEAGQDDVRETTSTPNGNDPSNDWAQNIRGYFSGIGEGLHQWHTELETNPDNPAFRPAIHDVNGGTFGGTSASNFLIWNRGTKEGTYDRWQDRVGSDYGFTAMNESFKTLENRSQNATMFSQSPPANYWDKDPFVPFAVPFLQNTDGQKFNASYHGDSGEICLAQNFIPSFISTPVKNVLETETLGPNRDTPFQGETGAVVAFDNTSLVGGTGYSTAYGVATTGGSGSLLTVDIVADAGVVTKVTVASGGSGYVPGETITIAEGGANATINVAPNQIFLDSENPNNPVEYLHYTPTTQYDQISTTFPGMNPYDSNADYGYTFDNTVLGHTAIVRGTEYAGNSQVVNNAIFGAGTSTFTKKNRMARCYAAPAFLYPIMDNTNVKVVPRAFITELIFDPINTTECIGVKWVENGWHVLNRERTINRNNPWIDGESNTSNSVTSLDTSSLNGGNGYSDSTAVATTGGTGSGLTVNITTAAGAVTAVTINARGSGYSVGDIVTITGGGADATISVLTIGSDASEVSRLQATKNQASVTTNVAYAAADVWLCLGAKNSAKQLQLAGIGDREFLSNLRNGDRISSRVNLSGVGNGVQDTLDMGIGYLHEMDTSTLLPAPFPAASPASRWGSIFGLVDPTDPKQPVNSTSMLGAPYDIDPSIRIKTQPHKAYSDMTLFMSQGDTVGTLGSLLWSDLVNYAKGEIIKKKLDDNHPHWDSYRWGFNDPNATLNVVNTHGIICEYFDLNSTGQVQIQSSDPFDDALYAPGMGNSESDIDAMVAAFRDTVLPLLKGLGKQRYGPRGPATYAGIILSGALAGTTVTVSPWVSTRAIDSSADPLQNPPFSAAPPLHGVPNSIIGWSITVVDNSSPIPTNTEVRTIVAYDGAGVVTISGPVASLDAGTLTGGTGYSDAVNVPTTGGTGTGLTVDITTAAGAVTTATLNNPGNGYVIGDTVTITTGGADATIDVLTITGWTLTGTGTVFTLQPPFATPLDTLAYSGPNHRAFSRLTRPNGDNFLSAYDEVKMTDTMSTSAGSTTISVSDVGHGLSIGDIVKISNLQGSNGAVTSLNTGTLSGGTGYSDSTAVATTGGTGSGLTVNITTSAGVVTAVTINARGSGYSAGDTVTINTGGTNATIDVLTIGQAVDSILIENFNEYHLVTATPDLNTFKFILHWNPTPVGGPGSSPVPNPAYGSIGVTSKGGTFTLEKMTFDETKFRKWLQRTYFSGWHKCCSCKMGKPDDPGAVVDTRARVYNTKGLRVCDASIFPVKPNANTQAPVYGIAQRVFELVSVEEYDKLLK